MAHVAKFKASAIGGMVNHYERGSQGVLERVNVDETRTPSNYNLGPEHPEGSIQFIRDRVESSHRPLTAAGKPRAIRKDAVHMADWVVTMPENVPDSQREAFFQSTYDFLEAHYGRENVIGSWVHLDEARPHMHFAWVPIDDNGKLNAQQVLNRGELRAFHPALAAHVEADLGRPVAILLDDQAQGVKQLSHLDQTEYIKAKETLAELHKQIEEQEAKKALALKTLSASTTRHEALTKTVEALKSNEISTSLRAQALKKTSTALTKEIEALHTTETTLRAELKTSETELAQLETEYVTYETASNELEAALTPW